MHLLATLLFASIQDSSSLIFVSPSFSVVFSLAIYTHTKSHVDLQRSLHSFTQTQHFAQESSSSTVQYFIIQHHGTLIQQDVFVSNPELFLRLRQRHRR